ncbi:hypothetical protein [Achromobacter sp.]|uniref:hypothetical protein n=1 Tax=Achromobacter sp. TaxID=134375 RepID=UPI00289CFB83|nr:hypothetical protein [Achromobacter sp.]
MHKPTAHQLAQAHAAANLRGTLADALQSPVLARCLEITAIALTLPAASRHKPQQGSTAAPPKSQTERFHFTPPRHDIKRASAADKDEIE